MKKTFYRFWARALWLYPIALEAHGQISLSSRSEAQSAVVRSAGVFLFAVVPLFLGLFGVFALKRLREKVMNYFLYVALGLMIFLFVSISAELWNSPPEPGVWSFLEYPLGFLTGAMTLLFYYSFKMSAFRSPMDSAMAGEFPEKIFLLQPPTAKERVRFNAYELSVAIAWGIGLHAIGEGIYMSSKIQGSQNYIEFAAIAVHKVVEGLGIVVPVAFSFVSFGRLLSLGLIASFPMAAGYLLGTLSGAGFLYAAASGAIFYGIVMLAEMAFRSFRADQNSVFSFFTICFSMAFFAGLDRCFELISRGMQ